MEHEHELTAALVALAEAGIPTDVQELLVQGDPMRGIAPGALNVAIRSAIIAATGSETYHEWVEGQRLGDYEVIQSIECDHEERPRRSDKTEPSHE